MGIPLVVEDYDSARRRGLDHDEAIMDVARRRNVHEEKLEELVEIRDELEICDEVATVDVPSHVPEDWK